MQLCLRMQLSIIPNDFFFFPNMSLYFSKRFPCSFIATVNCMDSSISFFLSFFLFFLFFFFLLFFDLQSLYVTQKMYETKQKTCSKHLSQWLLFSIMGVHLLGHSHICGASLNACSTLQIPWYFDCTRAA